MKKKQIMALLLSSTLALGAVSPVMAADPAENIPAAEATADTEAPAAESTAQKPSEYPEMMDSLVDSLNDLARSVAKDYWALSDAAKKSVDKLLADDPDSAAFLAVILKTYPNGSTNGKVVTVDELKKLLDDAYA